jgi:hypothetical protein
MSNMLSAVSNRIQILSLTIAACRQTFGISTIRAWIRDR